MKECAYCGQQNADEIVACVICGTELLPQKTAELAPQLVDPQLLDPALNLVIVGTYRNVVEATVVKTRLEAAGIEACIPEEYTPQIFWYAVPSPLERVTVRVAAKDYETARQILQDEA